MIAGKCGLWENVLEFIFFAKERSARTKARTVVITAEFWITRLFPVNMEIEPKLISVSQSRFGADVQGAEPKLRDLAFQKREDVFAHNCQAFGEYL